MFICCMALSDAVCSGNIGLYFLLFQVRTFKIKVVPYMYFVHILYEHQPWGNIDASKPNLLLRVGHSTQFVFEFMFDFIYLLNW